MLQIAGVNVSSPLVLAPLAGFTDLPCRLLCREYGAGLCVSEMISCHGLVYQQQKTLSMLRSCPEDRPYSIQLFGAEPEIMGEAAEIASSFNPDFLDINMGCPAKKVTKKGAGAALMADPGLAEKILQKVVRKSSVPVTVKCRLGTDSNNINCFDFATMAATCGAAALALHGRTWKQGFSGSADWETIARVKEKATLPVIGNGDIRSHAAAMTKIARGYCDAVMIGRAALGNPWIFSPSGRPEDPREICKTALRHIALLKEHHQNPERLLPAIRNHIGKYFRGFNGSAALRKLTYEQTSLPALIDLLHKQTTAGNSSILNKNNELFPGE